MVKHLIFKLVYKDRSKETLTGGLPPSQFMAIDLKEGLLEKQVKTRITSVLIRN